MNTRRSIRSAIAATLALAAANCSEGRTATSAATAGVDSVLAAAAPTPSLTIDTLATGLVIPWGIAVAPDGRVFVTERAGRLRLITATGLAPEPLMTPIVHAVDSTWHPESGLMGIALAPDFATTGHAYLSATVVRDPVPTAPSFVTRVRNRVGMGSTATDALPYENQVIRITINDSTASDPVVIARGIPTNHYHAAGGAIAFGPDGRLYLTVGDGRRPHLAQTEALVGKLLRFEADGSIPASNPRSGSPIFATGLRNTQGLAWLSGGALIGIEHGPSGVDEGLDLSGRDELNVLVRGGTYGWPASYGWEGSTAHTASIWVWGRSVAPAGLAVYAGPYAPWAGSVLVARLRGGLERLELAHVKGGWRAQAHELLPLPTLGRLRSVVVGGDGSVYLTTSNRDVRGTAGPHDDLLLRVRPSSAVDPVSARVR